MVGGRCTKPIDAKGACVTVRDWLLHVVARGGRALLTNDYDTNWHGTHLDHLDVAAEQR